MPGGSLWSAIEKVLRTREYVELRHLIDGWGIHRVRRSIATGSNSNQCHAFNVVGLVILCDNQHAHRTGGAATQRDVSAQQPAIHRHIAYAVFESLDTFK